MKKLIPTIVIVLVIAGAAVWLTLNLRAKRKYESLRDHCGDPYTAVHIDGKMKAFLSQVQSEWKKDLDYVGGPESQALKSTGMSPCVSNVVKLGVFQLPPYSFFSPSRNKRATLMVLAQGIVTPMSVHNTIYTSKDEHLAMILCQTNLVFLYTDETNGLQVRSYFTKDKYIEQKHPLDSE